MKRSYPIGRRGRDIMLAVAIVVAMVASASVGSVGIGPARAAAGSRAPSLLPAPAPSPPATPAVPTLSFTWPLPGTPPVLRPFQPPAGPYAPGHRGVDLGGSVGTPVLTAGAGVVGFAAPLAGRGVVTVLHDGGLRTTYEPVIAAVSRGQRVERGRQIGWLATPTGHCGPGISCLHWGLLRGSTYLDPLSMLGVRRVRLFPPDGGLPGTAPTLGSGVRAALGTAPGAALRPGATAANPVGSLTAASPYLTPATEGARAPATAGLRSPAPARASPRAPNGGTLGALAGALALAAATTLVLLWPRR